VIAKEYEVKVRVNDLSSVRKALINLGAVFKGRLVEEDYYIDLSNCTTLENRDVVFRVRVRLSNEVKEGELTLKGPRQSRDIKVREELNVKLDKPEELINMMVRLGFKVINLTKEREVYALNNMNVYLDSVRGLGEFMEVEAFNVRSDDEFKALLDELISKLDLKQAEVLSSSYIEMLLSR